MASKFVHLHTHSHYSLLDGLSKVDGLVKLAKEREMPALAITDHGNMYGAIEFYMTAKKQGVKAIMGVEGYIANRTRFDKQPGIDNKRFHITLLAKNMTGYKNLMKLVTKSNLEGYYYKPRMDKDLLRQYHEGIICLSGCLGGEFCKALWNKDEEEAERLAREYQSIFGPENFYLEVMHHPKLERMDEIKAAIIAQSKKLNIPLVATQDSHYLCGDDHKAHDTLLSIQTDATTQDANRFSFGDDDYSFINEETAREHFAECPEAVDNTVKIAEQCELELTIGKFIFPEYKIESGRNPDEELRYLCEKGLEKRKLVGDTAVLERLEYELGIIKFKGYAAYFLVVEDIIRFATESDIYSNIRGSVAGSMTTYLLGITKLNPLEYKIPFERFLNPERPSAPDIDMDFADNRREEVLDYTKRKYGDDKVAQIGTFGTMMARGAVRDVARALGHPYQIGDTISKLIPMGSQGFPMTIDHAMELEPELKKMYENDKTAKEILDLAKKLEGCVRHVSVHAAGVVISPEPLIEYAALQFDPKGGKIITQYDMYTVGEDGVGLTKFDFLGIRNLTILANAIKLIKIHRDLNIDIEEIPLDDKKTFYMLAHGETMGLFQLNGDGMTKWLMELKPTSIHDINAMVALYRPGPLQFIPQFIERKHHPELIKYMDQALEPILKQTYGILVYQDDLLIMAHNLAGYSWGEVDKFRKAVGKKIPEEMAKQKEKFIQGCVDVSKWPRKKAEEIWAWIEPFAAYGFNKAHAASYGRVAYQTAYLKANFPAEYMTAVLTAESGDVEEIAKIIEECKKMKIPVLPPEINESYGDFTTLKDREVADHPEEKHDQIRFGLYTIKNLGKEIADAIITERKEHGKFVSYANFLDRVKHKNLNKKSLEALIKAGAMDHLGERGQLMFNLDDALQYNKDEAGVNASQTSLFGLIDDRKSVPTLTLKPSEPVKLMDRLAWEKELLGLYVSGHPLEQFKDRFKKADKDIASIKKGNEGSAVIIGGLIESVKLIFTKKNDHMAFLKVADFLDSIEVVVFPKILTEFKEIIVADKCVAVRGRLSFRNGEPSIVAEAFKEITV
ncbi:MAG: DNA polymerase III subunit alpha [Candidatus Vogelbacteria bacterium]|nr:DNA polymerase III subunit alpha [Candidatus Vogelbacteria bacterium]